MVDERQLDGHTVSSPCEPNGLGELKYTHLLILISLIQTPVLIFFTICEIRYDFVKPKRVFTVCYSICIIWWFHTIVEPLLLTFRVFTIKFVGV